MNARRFPSSLISMDLANALQTACTIVAQGYRPGTEARYVDQLIPPSFEYTGEADATAYPVMAVTWSIPPGLSVPEDVQRVLQAAWKHADYVGCSPERPATERALLEAVRSLVSNIRTEEMRLRNVISGSAVKEMLASEGWRLYVDEKQQHANNLRRADLVVTKQQQEAAAAQKYAAKQQRKIEIMRRVIEAKQRKILPPAPGGRTMSNPPIGIRSWDLARMRRKHYVITDNVDTATDGSTHTLVVSLRPA